MRSCLITGAAGFLAQYVARVFEASGYALAGIDTRPAVTREMWRDYEQTSCQDADYERLFRSVQPDVICHLAGPASVPASVARPFDDFMRLLPGTARLLEAIGRAHLRTKVVFFSSAAVYGNPTVSTIDESCAIEPVSPYGVHKAAAELLTRHYAALYGFPAAALRIFSAYGPGLQRQVIWDIVDKALRAESAGEKSITLLGTGWETRDFVHASDVARAALCVAETTSPGTFDVFNVASGAGVAIREVAQMIIEELQSPLTVNFSGEVRPGDPIHWCGGIGHIRELGFEPEVAIRAGIRSVVAWVRQRNERTSVGG